MTELAQKPDIQQLAQTACKEELVNVVKKAYGILDGELILSKNPQQRQAAIHAFRNALASSKACFDAAWEECKRLE